MEKESILRVVKKMLESEAEHMHDRLLERQDKF